MREEGCAYGRWVFRAVTACVVAFAALLAIVYSIASGAARESIEASSILLDVQRRMERVESKLDKAPWLGDVRDEKPKIDVGG